MDEEKKQGETINLKDTGEAEPRPLKGIWFKFVSLIAILLSIFQLYTAWAGAFPNLIQRSIHLAFVLVLAFSLYPWSQKRSPKERFSFPDSVLVVLSLIACIFIVLNYDRIMLHPGESTKLEIALGILTTVLVLEATRRTLGIVLPILAILSLGYAYFGPYLPGVWAHRGFSTSYIFETLYLSSQGIWGMTTGVSATVVAAFLIFGAVLYSTGGGEIFVELAQWIAGRSHGGPAKVSCFSSAFFGTISGSAVANVVVDGVFNIPLMKRLGYKPEFAAAVEATASTGGQIMPPVMGAGAFIMAELIGIPYVKIALAAAIPAILYYIGVTACVHFEAQRAGLQKIPVELIPSIRKILPRSAPLFIPVVLLIFLMVKGYNPTLAVFWSIVSAIILYLIGGRSWRQFIEKFKNIINSLESGGRSIVLVASLCTCAQIIIGMFNLTGLGIKMSEIIIGLSAGSLFLALFFSMIICLILGMGVPTTAAYMIAASVAGPALSSLGIPQLAAHLFIFYFAIISAITPPVCAATYVAAAIARSNWLKTGYIAVKMGLAGFIAPFMFVYGPGILLIGSPLTIIERSLSASIGVIALAAGAMGFLVRKANWFERLLLILAAFLLIKPGYLTDILGFFTIVGIFLLQKHKGHKE